MYVCGITPYDATHLGHAATYLTFDLVYRLWLDSGHDVHYVQNITDVDDPLFERAAPRRYRLARPRRARDPAVPRGHGRAAGAAAARLRRRHRRHRRGRRTRREDAGLRGGLRRRRRRSTPTSTSGPTPPPQFGYESGYDRDTMLRLFGERGGDPRPRRQGRPNSTRCCGGPRAPGEPSWPSPFGPGRPGWHVECAAIALSRIGTGLDIQGGGSDLIFPHHEFSAAHAESVTGRAAIRPALRARRDDRLGRAQDVQEPRQPGAGVDSCAPRASSRRPSGWVCWPGTTAQDRFWSAAGARRRAGPAAALAHRDRACPQVRTPPT